MENQEQLLTGVPDDLTLREIVTKVPWRELSILSCVSRGWRNVIRSREVYEEKVHCGLTETFIIVDKGSHLVLCCLRDKSLLELPQCPGVPKEKAWSNSIVVDGRVYIFPGDPGGMVYMFDLAGRRVWTQCASMQIPRRDFGCGSMNGKVYVFGGRVFGCRANQSSTCEVEMFDPKENRWSRRTPMPLSRIEEKVLALGEELVLCSELISEQEIENSFQIYHPLKDKWRLVPDTFQRGYRVPIFVAKGKLHSMRVSCIEIQDFDGSPCRELHSNSFATILFNFHPDSIVVVEDEILALGVFFDESDLTPCFLRGRGLGTEKKVMVWQVEPNWPSGGYTRSMHAFRL